MKIQRLLRLAPAIWFAAIAAADLSATRVTAIPTPAAAGSMGSLLTRGPDGAVYLSWLEPVTGGDWAMKFSRFSPAHTAWQATRTVVQNAGLLANWADFPQLAVSPAGRITAVWFVNNPAHHAAPGHHGPGYRAIYAHSSDDGKTWSPDLPVSDESLPVEFVALQPLPDGRMLAAWLDGRAHPGNNGRQALYARVLDAPGPDTRVDDSVCDCCQLSFAPTPGGGALLAYRGRTAEEVRDIQLARFDGGAWSRLPPPNADGWKIAGCPVNGPQLAENGPHLGAVWFTAANNESRVLARASADAGKNFGPAVRVDLGRPQGRVDNVMLADGTLVVTWLEATGPASGGEGGIYLRLLSPAGELSPPHLVAPSRTSRMTGFPRLGWLGGRRLLLTSTQEGEPSRVLAFRIDLD